MTISSNLTWNAHIKEVIKKARKRLYYLVQLKRARLPVENLVLFYTTCVRSVVDYVVPAFCPSVILKERLNTPGKKRDFNYISPHVDCLAAREVLNMKLIEEN